MDSDKFLKSVVKHDEEFISVFKNFLKVHNLNTKEFSKISNIPLNTLYKIVSNSEKDFRISTLRNIYATMRSIEGTDKDFIAIIMPRVNLDKIKETIKTSHLNINNKKLRIREYATLSIEEIITMALRAKREGARGIVCGPIASNTIRRVVDDIPIIAVGLHEDSVNDAVKRLKELL